ncbi:MAG: PadR family transcriptional regulator [Roseburia sp.]|nr:PadR family transcriptional regulator [Roseburia sp.]MCM1099036.1 PadR family transcriptional regulator [Ruminococcus flavefaciens]
MEEGLLKKYVPMTETTYYTLLAVTVPRHGYAIMQYVSGLTKGRIVLGTGTLYTMVGRLVADGVIETVPNEEKKAYRITETGMALLKAETERLGKQLADGETVLRGCKDFLSGQEGI